MEHQIKSLFLFILILVLFTFPSACTLKNTPPGAEPATAELSMPAGPTPEAAVQTPAPQPAPVDAGAQTEYNLSIPLAVSEREMLSPAEPSTQHNVAVPMAMLQGLVPVSGAQASSPAASVLNLACLSGGNTVQAEPEEDGIYRLEIPPGGFTECLARYPNLPPGDYRLEVAQYGNLWLIVPLVGEQGSLAGDGGSYSGLLTHRYIVNPPAANASHTFTLVAADGQPVKVDQVRITNRFAK